MEAINLYREPELRSPYLVAAWPGMGGVATIAARYLKERLGAEEFGTIEPYDFFHPSVVPIRGSVVEEPQFPESKFYSWSRGGEDLIIFTAEAQPHIKGYRLANLVLDIAQRFKAKMVCTFAASPSHIYHGREPKVLGVATSTELLSELEKHGVTPMSGGAISGMNGVLLGVAKKRAMEGFCLLGEIPLYTTQIANPRSSKAILEVLTEILHIEIDMKELDDWGSQTDQEIEQNIERLRQSAGEEAKGFVDYLEQLKQASAEEFEAPSKYTSEELFKQIEQFLRKRREQKEDH